MKRSSLEKITASLVITLTTVLTFGFILIVANLMFSWDILTPFTEKIVYFISVSTLVVVIAATMTNIMLNISRVANSLEKIVKKGYEEKTK